jgi:hypothetical protein
VLAEFARQSRAFRWHAMAALSVMRDPSGMEALHELLHAPGAEARCGALRAIRTRSPGDPVAKGEVFGDPASPTLRLVSVASPAEPLVHFMRYREPEVAIFGHELRLQTPFSIFAGKEIIVKSIDANRVKLTRFVPGEDERRLECSTRLDDVVRNIVAIGGGYADVLQAVQEAQRGGWLLARVEINALPTPDRKYDGSEESSDEILGIGTAATPAPDLYYDHDNNRDVPISEPQEGEVEAKPGFWGKMKGWLGGGE